MQGKKRWLAGVALSGSVILAGCVSTGRPLPVVARADIPLVPVPPPPLGRPQTPAADTSVSADVPPPAPPPPTARLTPAEKTAVPAAALTARQLVQTAQARYARID